MSCLSSKLGRAARLLFLGFVAAQALVGSAAPGSDRNAEREPSTEVGWNDAIPDAQPVPHLAPGQTIHVRGALATPATPVTHTDIEEIDDGSIPAAQTAPRSPFTWIVKASIGDGKHPVTGDFDYYRLTMRSAGTVMASARARSELNPAVVLLDADGTVLDRADDQFGDTSATLVKRVAGPGAYFVMVMASGSAPADVFNAASGHGARSTGEYELRITAATADIDTYAVQLRAGDVVGAAASKAVTQAGVFDADGNELQSSTSDAGNRRSASSPLPRGAVAVEEVATRPGWYYVVLTGNRGSYVLTVSVFRPVVDPPGPRQRLLVDFDGAVLDTTVFSQAGLPPESLAAGRSFSPAGGFLPRWGLRPADLAPVKSAIAEHVRRTLDIAARSAPTDCRPAFEVSDRDAGAAAWGMAGVSRVVVGGSIAETGLPTIGVAESVDPGNFDTTETAVVLLDTLSAEGDEPYSINAYLTPASNRVQFVAEVVGDYVLHEIGHLLGSWHSNTYSGVPDLMDDTNIALAVAGADRVGGTPDDVHLTFGSNRPFHLKEGFTGRQNAAGRTAVAISNCS